MLLLGIVVNSDGCRYFLTGCCIFVVGFHLGRFCAGIGFAELERGYTCGENKNP